MNNKNKNSHMNKYKKIINYKQNNYKLLYKNNQF